MKIQSPLDLAPALALLLPLGACVVVSSDTDSATEGSSTSTSDAGSDSATSSAATETSSVTSTTGSASDSDSDSAGSTTADATSTSDDTDTESTTGSTSQGSDTDPDTTTGGDPEAILESCKAACGVLLECYPDQFDSLEACAELCVNESTPPEPDAACEAANVALNTCLGAASCADLEEEGLCAAEEDAIDEVCGGGDECFGSGGGNEEGTECEISEECVGEYKHELRCTVDTCECYVDDEKTMECAPMMNLCAEFDPSVLEDYALECCGW